MEKDQLGKGENEEIRETAAPSISIIIPAKNEASTISKVVREAKKISKNCEVLVICNGSKDNTPQLAHNAGAKVLVFKHSLGHDTGRSIGAYFASGDILLFIDADFVIPATTLRAYCDKVMEGWDVVLNAYSGYTTRTYIHSTSEAKRLLNRLLKRGDLQGSSLSTVPHALSRRAVEVIGYKELAVPPKAQAIAILRGLRVTTAKKVTTSKLNRKRGRKKKLVEKLMLGDHMEAINYLVYQRGERGGYTDFHRKRYILLDPDPPVQTVEKDEYAT